MYKKSHTLLNFHKILNIILIQALASIYIYNIALTKTTACYHMTDIFSDYRIKDQLQLYNIMILAKKLNQLRIYGYE